MNLRKEPPLGYLLPTAWRQAGEDKKRETWCRTAANLFSGLVCMTSNSRVLESIPYQHLRRVWLERRTLFHMKLLSGVHLRTRTCVSLRQHEPSRGATFPIKRTHQCFRFLNVCGRAPCFFVWRRPRGEACSTPSPSWRKNYLE